MQIYHEKPIRFFLGMNTFCKLVFSLRRYFYQTLFRIIFDCQSIYGKLYAILREPWCHVVKKTMIIVWKNQKHSYYTIVKYMESINEMYDWFPIGYFYFHHISRSHLFNVRRRQLSINLHWIEYSYEYSKQR